MSHTYILFSWSYVLMVLNLFTQKWFIYDVFNFPFVNNLMKKLFSCSIYNWKMMCILNVPNFDPAGNGKHFSIRG